MFIEAEKSGIGIGLTIVISNHYEGCTSLVLRNVSFPITLRYGLVVEMSQNKPRKENLQEVALSEQVTERTDSLKEDVLPEGRREIELLECERGEDVYNLIRDKHYAGNGKIVGRQKHYLVYVVKPYNALIGIITGASPPRIMKVREYFGLSQSDNYQGIIQNSVFRLEHNEPNLGSQILALWRKRVVKDFEEKWGQEIIGFCTFIGGTVDNEPDSQRRNGVTYLADIWKCIGETKGFKSTRGAHLSTKVDKKLIFCRKVAVS